MPLYTRIITKAGTYGWEIATLDDIKAAAAKLGYDLSPKTECCGEGLCTGPKPIKESAHGA